jgi:hypothetical protein
MPALVVSIPRFRLRRCRRQGHGVREAWARRKEPSCFGFLAGEPHGLACEAWGAVGSAALRPPLGRQAGVGQQRRVSSHRLRVTAPVV